MRKKKRRRRAAHCPQAIPSAEWLPPESSPTKYYSQLVFANPEGGSGPLCILGRELQLVWYETKRDRDRQHNGKLVCVLEFRDCHRVRDFRGERYYFSGLLLEDLSGAYREWLGHQQHRGRPFGKDTEVLETEVAFSVAVPAGAEDPLAAFEQPAQPFFIHQPDVEELSSPQLDMLFDVMAYLYQNIPALELMESVRAERLAEMEEARSAQTEDVAEHCPIHG